MEQKGWEAKVIPTYTEELGVEKSGVGGELLRDPVLACRILPFPLETKGKMLNLKKKINEPCLRLLICGVRRPLYEKQLG